MASEQPSIVMPCTIHKDNIGVAICITHYDFLCVTCILDKSKSKDCKIQEIKHCQDERLKCILEHMTAKQTVIQLKDSFATALSQTQGVKETLLQEIEDLHTELSCLLTKKASLTKELVEKEAGYKEKEIVSQNMLLDECIADLETNLKKIGEKGVDFEKCSESYTDINARINIIVSEWMSEVNGSFNPNKYTEDFSKDETLGTVNIISQRIYEEMNTDNPNVENVLAKSQQALNVESDQDIQTSVNTSQNIQHDSSGQSTCQTKAQANAPDGTQHNASEQRTPAEPTETEATQSMVNAEQATHHNPTETKTELTHAPNERRSWFWGLFKRRHVSNRESRLLPYASNSSHQLTEYVNTKMKLPGIESSPTPSKYTQLVHLGDNVVGLLCHAQSTVFVTTLPNGPTQRKTFSGTISGIVATGSKELAVLVGEHSQINLYSLNLENDKLNKSRSCTLPKTIKDITGFDFNAETSIYAISSPSMRVILDKKGKVIKTLTIPVTSTDDSPNIQSLYDFESDQIVYLNVAKKKLKSFSCQNEVTNILWKKRCDDEDFKPKRMCIHKNVICVASGNSIVTFLTQDGSPVERIEIFAVLDDCLAVCAIDDVLIWTSDSDDPELSANIGFIAF